MTSPRLQHISATMLSALAAVALALVILQAPVPIFAQGSDSATRTETPRTPLSSKVSALNLARPAAPTEADSGACADRQPQITVSVPAPAPVQAPWTLRDRITWASNLGLVACGYVGIMLALSTLKKIERQTHSTEMLATAAADRSQAALLNVQAILNSERPWVLISVELGLKNADSFTVTATNRGRLPAKLVAVAEHTAIATDEEHLPVFPEYPSEKAGLPFSPTILLPGESTPMVSIFREDMVKICASEEQRQRVENWEEKIYLYGKILYQDLMTRPDEQTYETCWCCWYIHGRSKSGLVMAGPASYNSHT